MKSTTTLPPVADDTDDVERSDAGALHLGAPVDAFAVECGRGTRHLPRLGYLALAIAFALAAAVGVAWPELAAELARSGVRDPDSIIQLVGSSVLLIAAGLLGVGAFRSIARRRVGLATVSIGSAVLGVATIAVALGGAATIGVIPLDGPSVGQVAGITILIAGVVSMPSTLRWNAIAIIDVTLVATAALALLWLAPLRGSSGPEGGLLDVTHREPTAIALVALMVVGVILLVRVVQASGPGDLALATAVLLIPSSLYDAIVGQHGTSTAASARGSMLWWLCGPGTLAIAGYLTATAAPASAAPPALTTTALDAAATTESESSARHVRRSSTRAGATATSTTSADDSQARASATATSTTSADDSQARASTTGATATDVGDSPSGVDDASDTDDDATRRMVAAEWVVTVATVLTLGAVATQRVFIDSLDPVLVGFGVIAVLLTSFRLALLQQRQTAMQLRLGTLAQELHDRARTDALTGLGNRLALVEEIDRLLGTGAERSVVHAFYVDVDDFKTVNDTLGHETGDRLLRCTADRLVAAAGDATYRIGGDEFVALIAGLSLTEANEVAQSIVDVAVHTVEVDGMDVSARLSVGVAHAQAGPGATSSGDDLLQMADLALNRAKELGRCRANSYDEGLQERADRRLAVQQGLLGSVDRREFDVRYRPVVDVVHGHVIGIESVVRWESPDHQMLLADEYFTIAAQSGLVAEISRSNLRLAAAPWFGADRPSVALSVNLTLPELLHGGLPDDIEALVESIPLHLLRLQIPEAALMAPAAQRTVHRLVAAGMGICVRDFGTATSSLRSLAQLPHASIRIDGSFVSGLEHRNSDRLIVQTVVGICNELGVDVIADGVMQANQVDRLLELGRDRAPGWLFGRPVPWGERTHSWTDPADGPAALAWRPRRSHQHSAEEAAR